MSSTRTSTARTVAAMLGPVVIGVGAIGVGALVGGAGPASAQVAPTTPGISSIEIENEDGHPTFEMEYVTIQGEHRELTVDLWTGRAQDAPEGD